MSAIGYHLYRKINHLFFSVYAEYDRTEDRKSSMNSNSGIRRPKCANVWLEVINFQFEGQQLLETIRDTILLRTNLWSSKVAAPEISTYSWLDDRFLLRIDNSVDKTVRKSVNFLSLVLKGYNKNFNSARQPDNSYYYRTESLQTSDELYSQYFNDSTLPSVGGTQCITNVLHNALTALILKISMLLKCARQYRHVVIIMVILTQVDCKGKLLKMKFVNVLKKASLN